MTTYKPNELVSDCCGARPLWEYSAEVNGTGRCSQCKEDCVYITQKEFDDYASSILKQETKAFDTSLGKMTGEQILYHLQYQSYATQRNLGVMPDQLARWYDNAKSFEEKYLNEYKNKLTNG